MATKDTERCPVMSTDARLFPTNRREPLQLSHAFHGQPNIVGRRLFVAVLRAQDIASHLGQRGRRGQKVFA